MKMYAIKEKSTGKISIVHTNGDPVFFMKQIFPDKIISGSGSTDDPHIYESTAEIIGNISKKDLPNKNFRDQWREDGGKIKVDIELAKKQKIEDIKKERNSRLKESDEVWTEIMSKGADISKISSYKQSLRDLPKIVESELNNLNDIDSIDSYQPSYPEKP